jgi:signal transduction histidine kinase
VTGEARARPGGDELRRIVPIFALAVAIVAALTDPSSVLDVVLIAVPVAAFALWTVAPPSTLSLTLTSLAIVATAVATQRSGNHEPIMFEVSLLAFVIGRWSESLVSAAALGLLALVSPVLVHVLESDGNIRIGIWMLGIAFPWTIARAVLRQAQLARELEDTRRELAEQAILDERRRIARDVHDFVGHGLAAMMLQVTSARHVLRRDPRAAEEALKSAEEVGRRSMQELRRTVALLRSDDQPGVLPPVPSATEVPALVDHARAGGLDVEARTEGDLSAIPPAVGLAVYRIAQEALANAARHAPRARTLLALELANGSVSLTAESTGPVAPSPPADGERRRYGLVGMRERAAALGGELSAGPTPEGWCVRCRLPLESE